MERRSYTRCATTLSPVPSEGHSPWYLRDFPFSSASSGLSPEHTQAGNRRTTGLPACSTCRAFHTPFQFRGTGAHGLRLPQRGKSVPVLETDPGKNGIRTGKGT